MMRTRKTQMRWGARLAGLSIAAVFALAACSGGRGSEADITADAPDRDARARFVERADALCLVAADQLAPLGSRADVAELSKSAVQKFEIAVPIYRLLVAGLQQLELPAGHEAEVARLIEAFERVAEKGEEVIRSGVTGDQGAYAAAVADYWVLLDDAIAANHGLGLSCP